MDPPVLEKARKGDLSFFTQQKNELELTIKQLDEDGRTLFHNAVTSGNSELVDFFLQNTSAEVINTQDEEGWSPLHSAVSLGYDRIAEILLDHGAEVDIKTTAKRTPLHYAASKGRLSLVRLLWKRGASMDARDEIGCTALHRAAGAGQLQVVRILVDEVKVNKEVYGKAKQTPLTVALEAMNESVALFLLSRGAQLEDGEHLTNIPERMIRALQDAKEGRIDVDDL